MKVRFAKATPSATMPILSSTGAAAFDFFAGIENPIEISPGQRALVPLGVVAEIPQGYGLMLHSRSGHGLKNGVTLANSVGVIDSDYRGILGALVINHGDSTFNITPNMKICQGVIHKLPEIQIEEASIDQLTSTYRGEGGFGSTGN